MHGDGRAARAVTCSTLYLASHTAFLTIASAPFTGVTLTNIPDQQRNRCRRRRSGLLDLLILYECQSRPALHAKASRARRPALHAKACRARSATGCDVTRLRCLSASTLRQGCTEQARCDDQKLVKQYHIDEGMKEVNNT